MGRILPHIMERIEHSAFVIADLTELKSNVFFELGYADGLKKPVVVTAMAGTQLPFDVKDVPTIFWDGQRKLKDDLRAKIGLIARGVQSASADEGAFRIKLLSFCRCRDIARFANVSAAPSLPR